MSPATMVDFIENVFGCSSVEILHLGQNRPAELIRRRDEILALLDDVWGPKAASSREVMTASNPPLPLQARDPAVRDAMGRWRLLTVPSSHGRTFAASREASPLHSSRQRPTCSDLAGPEPTS
jgi:hypothetical protein